MNAPATEATPIKAHKDPLERSAIATNFLMSTSIASTLRSRFSTELTNLPYSIGSMSVITTLQPVGMGLSRNQRSNRL